MISAEEIADAARDNATETLSRFAELLESPIRDLLAAAYVAGANHVIKSFVDGPIEEVVTNAN